MGNAAHELIAYHYEAAHLPDQVAKNSVVVQKIVEDAGGDTKLVLPSEAKLRPDITNIRLKQVFEIKKHGDKELKEGRAEVTLYLNALNRAMPAEKQFTRGTGYSGALGVQFAYGVAAWRLSWQTTEPGVVQYRWQRLNPKDQAMESYREAYEQGRWVDVSTAEMEQYGEKLYQAVQTIVRHRTLLEQIRTGVSVPIAITGIAASAVLMTSMDKMMSSKAQIPLSPAAPIPPPMPRPVAPPAPALPPRIYVPPPSMRPPPRPPAPPSH